MCRFLKPPRPVENKDGKGGGGQFEWNPDMISLPFGTWKQLRLRQHCSICRLVTSLITAGSETDKLHPHLANADPEVQGTGLYINEIEDTGERVLTVDCNQRVVGHLRILSKDNESWPSGDYVEAQLAAQVFRYGSASGDGKVAPETITRWLNDCELNHGRACNRPAVHGGH